MSSPNPQSGIRPRLAALVLAACALDVVAVDVEPVAVAELAVEVVPVAVAEVAAPEAHVAVEGKFDTLPLASQKAFAN